MEALVIYISKSALLLSLFFLAYLLLLKKDTSFQLNRLFLLSGILIAASLPAMEFTRQIYLEASLPNFDFPQSSSGEALATSGAEPSVDWWFLSGMLYVAGVAFLFLKLLFQLISLVLFLKRAERSTENGYTFFKTDRKTQPFSFFKNIAYNPALHSERELNLILRHEIAHARQWHSVDVLLANLTSCLLWFNPLVWLYKKYLLQNLEYLADRETVTASGSKKEYQKALIQASVGELTPVLANHFYQSLIKKRIIMLNKKTTSKNTFWKAGLVLPFLAAFFLGFQVKTEARILSTAPQNIADSREEEFSVTLSSNISDESLQGLSRLFSKRGIELNFDTVERNADGDITNIQISYRKKDDAQTGSYNQNNSGGIQPFRFFTKENGETGFETIQEPTETPTAAFNYSPDKLTGKDLLIVLSGETHTMKSLQGKYIQIGGDMDILDPEEAKERFGTTGKDGALVLSNGKLINNLDTAMRQLDSQSAAAKQDYLHINEEFGAVLMNVHKSVDQKRSEDDEDSDSLNFTKKFRKSKFTAPGVHAIQLDNTNEVYRSALDNQSQNPLYVVDGEVQPKDFRPNELNPESIKSINVLKNESATDKYGEKGKYGVIEINLKKKGDEPTEPKSEKTQKDLTYTAEKITIRTTADSSSVKKGERGSTITITGVANANVERQDSRLYVLNGEVMDNDFDPSTVDPENIDSIVVLKGDLAVEKYGKKAADGVIEINTKE